MAFQFIFIFKPPYFRHKIHLYYIAFCTSLFWIPKVYSNDLLAVAIGTSVKSKDFYPVVSAYYNRDFYTFTKWLNLSGELSGSLTLIRCVDVEQKNPNNVALSAIPMLNFTFTKNFSMNAGIGLGYLANGFVSYHTDAAQQSSHFNFSDNIGFTYDFIPHGLVLLRLTHWSNATTFRPNPGLTVLNLGFGYRF